MAVFKKGIRWYIDYYVDGYYLDTRATLGGLPEKPKDMTIKQLPEWRNR
ncbi:MAG: hypothetical protein J7K40_01410 [candidate division Zixibacteria bacterium]|nr:hypothetical protein [candidate division Zixibacteria bacterium]